MSGATTATPRNPWMTGLTVMWVLLLTMSLLLLVAGASAQGIPDGSDGALIVTGGVLGALALVVIGVQLGVGAVRWYLDESSRLVPPTRSEQPIATRQDV